MICTRCGTEFNEAFPCPSCLRRSAEIIQRRWRRYSAKKHGDAVRASIRAGTFKKPCGTYFDRIPMDEFNTE